MLTLTPRYTLRHTLTHPDTCTRSHSPRHMLTPRYTFTHTPGHMLTPRHTLTQPDTCSHSHSDTRSHPDTHSHSHPDTYSYTWTHTHTDTCSHPDTCSHQTHTHPHTRSPPDMCSPPHTHAHTHSPPGGRREKVGSEGTRLVQGQPREQTRAVDPGEEALRCRQEAPGSTLSCCTWRALTAERTTAYFLAAPNPGKMGKACTVWPPPCLQWWPRSSSSPSSQN